MSPDWILNNEIIIPCTCTGVLSGVQLTKAEGRVYFTDSLCCTVLKILVCLLVVNLLLTVFLALSVPFCTLLGSSVLPAGLAAVTYMREEPISLQGRQSEDLWLLELSLRLCGHVFANLIRHTYIRISEIELATLPQAAQASHVRDRNWSSAKPGGLETITSVNF